MGPRKPATELRGLAQVAKREYLFEVIARCSWSPLSGSFQNSKHVFI